MNAAKRWIDCLIELYLVSHPTKQRTYLIHQALSGFKITKVSEEVYFV